MNDLEATRKFTSFAGNKLLQHMDVLNSIQAHYKFVPIMVELCLTESCDSDCIFCSVAGRPLKSRMPWHVVESVLCDFRSLGAKSLEITGGGNPMLYSDSKHSINDVIMMAHGLGYKIGLITNSHDLRRLNPGVHDMIDWVRISLIKLDEGVEPEEYNFNGFPLERLGFSYILYETGGKVDELSRTGRVYEGTSRKSIERIAKLVNLHPRIKFVRIYGNCLMKGGHPRFRKMFEDAVRAVDEHGKMFIKVIGDNDGPYDNACFLGMVRPYVAPDVEGTDYFVYPCNSFVLNTRTYDPAYALCRWDEIVGAWSRMNENFRERGYPYSIKGNDGKGWCKTCKYCYFSGSNEILHWVGTTQPDRDFI